MRRYWRDQGSRQEPQHSDHDAQRDQFCLAPHNLTVRVAREPIFGKPRGALALSARFIADWRYEMEHQSAMKKIAESGLGSVLAEHQPNDDV